MSEGTLRLLALTVIAYLPDAGRIYLIEEPENGIHPLATEAVYQSLSSVYGSHVFITTHSEKEGHVIGRQSPYPRNRPAPMSTGPATGMSNTTTA